ncbi:MAG TPA: response regulator [Candidatus Saccharimonadales bacterium]|nr:response regulator [Candidatus Saccharimonadales bacterium]
MSFLVVDEDEDIGPAIQTIIQDTGNNAQLETDAHAALERLTSHECPYQGLFLDTNINSLTAFLLSLREKNTRIPITLIDTNDVFLESQRREFGITTYIEKPFSSLDIQLAVNEMQKVVLENK